MINSKTMQAQESQSGVKANMNPDNSSNAVSLPSPAKPSAPPNENVRHGPPKPLIAVVVIALLATAGWFGYKQYATPPADNGILKVSGRIEGYETNVGPKIGGRVDFIAHREGDMVKQGELLVKISDDDVQAQLRSAMAKKQRAKDLADQSTYQINVVNSQIEEAQLRVTQSAEDMRAQIDQADANVSQAEAKVSESEAQVTQAQSDLKLAKIRKQRYAFLASKGAVTLDENDQANTTAATAEAIVSAKTSALDASRKQLNVAKAALNQAKSTRLNPSMRRAQVNALSEQLSQAKYQVKSALQEVKSAQADQDQINANIAYLNIRSPISGVVTARVVEPGAVAVPGQTLLSLIDLNTVYLRGYVPEGRIGSVRVGQRARVFLDSAPDKPLEGEVIQIDPEASFTPENIYFKDDRVKQVFGIKIGIKQPDRFAKPGMPADAEILPEAASR
jgi:HlyD family secretion protein